MIPKNLTWHAGEVTYEDRCRLLGQQGLVVWFTGLSGSGKSTIAVGVEKALHDEGRAIYRLDGDNVRHGLNSDLGFSVTDRDENIRRIAEVAALMKDAGLIVLACFISPYRAMREIAKIKIGAASFLEVYIQADLTTCRKRDPKGLYQKADRGEIPLFTGVSDPYEKPENPDVMIDTTTMSITESVHRTLQAIRERQKFLGQK